MSVRLFSSQGEKKPRANKMYLTAQSKNRLVASVSTEMAHKEKDFACLVLLTLLPTYFMGEEVGFEAMKGSGSERLGEVCCFLGTEHHPQGLVHREAMHAYTCMGNSSPGISSYI